jgi:pimeloyl-ACP methyl ester carboxylesterase
MPMSLPPAGKTASLPNGLKLPYLDLGSPDALPIVFLHGITDSCHSFGPVIVHLPGTFRVLALTQRGHGDASVPDGYRLTDLAGDLESFLDVLSLERIILIGHSMGAAVAQRFAIDNPERVLGLVLVGAFAALGRNPACAEFGETTLASLTDPVEPTFVREFQESTLAQPLPQPVLDGIVAESLKVPAKVWKAAWAGLLEADLTPDLPFISAPTLLIWGDRDDIALRSEQDVLWRSIPNPRLETFAGAGHAPHWEEPERFAALVADFVASVVPTGRRAGSDGT